MIVLVSFLDRLVGFAVVGCIVVLESIILVLVFISIATSMAISMVQNHLGKDLFVVAVSVVLVACSAVSFGTFAVRHAIACSSFQLLTNRKSQYTRWLLLGSRKVRQGNEEKNSSTRLALWVVAYELLASYNMPVVQPNTFKCLVPPLKAVVKTHPKFCSLHSDFLSRRKKGQVLRMSKATGDGKQGKKPSTPEKNLNTGKKHIQN